MVTILYVLMYKMYEKYLYNFIDGKKRNNLDGNVILLVNITETHEVLLVKKFYCYYFYY